VRSLNPEEADLWARVAATIRPLSREIRATRPAEKILETEGSGGVGRSVPAAARPPVTSAKPLPGTTLDGSWDRKLRNGTVEPDRIVDLHGKTLDSAWRAIDRSLEQAIDAGDRVVLLITGHHRPGEPPIKRGQIRAAVHDWLEVSRHAPQIAAVRGAHRRHGGGGSLYLILRRR